MNKTITVKGIYRRGTEHSSKNWDQVCADHEEELPLIRECVPGTFNVSMAGSPDYIPPDDSEYRTRAKKRGESVKRYEHGNHLAPRSKVIEINDQKVEAWIYRGGNPEPHILELISAHRLAELLNIQNGEELIVLIEEVEEGAASMPKSPPKTPGKTIGRSGKT